VKSAEGRIWVVDASVAFGWFAQVPGSVMAVQLLEASPPARLIAPDLVLAELLNAGWKAPGAGAITEAQLEGIAQLAPGLFTELVPAIALLPAQLLCRLLDHPATDCLELALAGRQNAVLLTQEEHLLRKLESLPQATTLALALKGWQPDEG